MDEAPCHWNTVGTAGSTLLPMLRSGSRVAGWSPQLHMGVIGLFKRCHDPSSIAVAGEPCIGRKKIMISGGGGSMTGLAQFLGVAALVALIVLGWQWRERKRSTVIAELARAGGPYHCVALKPRAGCCPAVRKAAGTRYLSRQAPPLPLPNCTAASCRCTYLHFDDRRDSDRRMPFAPRRSSAHGDKAGERRRGTDRRRSGSSQPELV